MNVIQSEARSSPGNELTPTPALIPMRGGIILRWFETTKDEGDCTVLRKEFIWAAA